MGKRVRPVVPSLAHYYVIYFILFIYNNIPSIVSRNYFHIILSVKYLYNLRSPSFVGRRK